jgi:hypothetical protein
MVARRGSPGDAGSSMNGLHAPTGDHKGPPRIHPAALAPTESWVGAYVDAWWRSLVVALGGVGTI